MNNLLESNSTKNSLQQQNKRQESEDDENDDSMKLRSGKRVRFDKWPSQRACLDQVEEYPVPDRNLDKKTSSYKAHIHWEKREKITIHVQWTEQR